MPEHLRALVVILALGGAVFWLAKPAACGALMPEQDFARRRNLWFAVTLAAFLAHNFWIYVAAVAAMMLLALPHERNRLALFYFLLFAVPAIRAPIPGFGLTNYLFDIDYPRLLTLTLLLPAFLALYGREDAEPFGRPLADKILAGYLALTFFLVMLQNSFTDTLRAGLFYAFTDVFLPYYVASRSLRSVPEFREALGAFVLGALVLAAVACVEFAKHWLLYVPLAGALGVYWDTPLYLARGDSLRALGSAGHAIPLGYVMTVALGFVLCLKGRMGRLHWRLALALLVAGSIASLSRGPWVGAAAALLVFIASGPLPTRRFAQLGVCGALLAPLLLSSTPGQTIIDHLPIVGSVDEGNIYYRQRLLEISLQVFMLNPLFGAYDFLQSPLMQQLRTGQGIIDVVNTYVGVALSTGLAGLALFAGFFVAVLAGLVRAMLGVPGRHDERYLLGQGLLATLAGILVTIFTVSSITVIPVIYWTVAGLCAGYARLR
jgi:hypothetical protein